MLQSGCPMSDIEFELMQSWHLPAVYELECELFAGEEWSLAQFREELAQVPASRLYWVALAEQKVVGYFGIMLVDDFADIATLAVAVPYRGQGLGSRMVRTMLATAAERGARRVLLEVRVTNESAIRLYEQFGFKRIAERPNYYGPGLDAYMMELDPLVVPNG